MNSQWTVCAGQGAHSLCSYWIQSSGPCSTRSGEPWDPSSQMRMLTLERLSNSFPASQLLSGKVITQIGKLRPTERK